MNTGKLAYDASHAAVLARADAQLSVAVAQAKNDYALAIARACDAAWKTKCEELRRLDAEYPEVVEAHALNRAKRDMRCAN